VREAVGIFDVSHLGKATGRGPGAAAYVNATLTNDLGRIGPARRSTRCAATTRPAASSTT
jgi:aminomethyltransferase